MEVQHRLSSAIPFGALTTSTFKPHAPNIGDIFCCSRKTQIPILRFGIRDYETEETIPRVWEDGKPTVQDEAPSPGTPLKNQNVEYIARQRHIATQQPPDDVRELIEEHEAIIPPAGAFFPITKKTIGNINKEESFNRRERIRAFYYLIVLQEARNPAENGSQQVDRFADTLLAIENLSTLKVAALSAKDIPKGEKFIEDPKVMHTRLKQGGIHQLKKPFRKQFFNTVVDDGRQTPYGNPNIFPHRKNSVFVMPSTCEFSFIDQDGRIMVIRVQEEPEGRLKPYDQSYGTDSDGKHAKQALDDALQNGKIIFSVPKKGTNLQGKAQSGIFIGPDWQLPANVRAALPVANAREVFEHLVDNH